MDFTTTATAGHTGNCCQDSQTVRQYKPATKLVKGVGWPKYQKAKRNKEQELKWQQEDRCEIEPEEPGKFAVSTLSATVLAYIAKNPWQTATTIHKDLGMNNKVVTARLSSFATTGRVLVRYVESERGTARGFAINPTFRFKLG